MYDRKAVQSSNRGEFKGAWSEMITGSMLNNVSEEVPENHMKGDVGVFPRLIQVATMNRRFCISKQGYIGIGSWSIQVGDHSAFFWRKGALRSSRRCFTQCTQPRSV
jgi:hypothetical protein